jgi:methylenetetrahydrofolate reductase (NADPH)
MVAAVPIAAASGFAASAATGIVSASDAAGLTQLIAAFAGTTSFATARLTAEDLAALTAGFPPGTPVYVTAIPARPPTDEIDIATRLAAAGFEPVPHIAGRSFSRGADLDRHLGQLTQEAAVRRVMVVGGDATNPAGAFHAASEVIESGLLHKHDIAEIGIAGYPDGHPRLTATDLDRALAAKLEVATSTGLAVHIVTQFAFSTEAILAWIVRLRDLGIDHPIRIGLPGPAPLAALLRHARICGVAASAQALAGNAVLSRHVFGLVTPDAALRRLAQARLGDAAPHIYAFGGLAAAARWASALAAGRISLDRDGFSVAPPLAGQ